MKLREIKNSWMVRAALFCASALAFLPGSILLYGQTKPLVQTIHSTTLINRIGEHNSIKTAASSSVKLSDCYIQGPTNVNAGTTYWYNLSCGWGEPNYIYQWEALNGTMQDYGDGGVYITWNAGAFQGYVNVYDGYNLIATLKVYINHVDPLLAGTITTGGGGVCYGSSAANLEVSSASGGNCYNQYTYQWQVSYDNIYWYDIAGATRNGNIYPSIDPAIFEVRDPNTDIQGRVIVS